jgi:hypothetical protein
VALLLLEIPGVAQRYGVFDPDGNGGRKTVGRRPDWGDLDGRDAVASPLLWLAQRLAKNRERIGVHYPSDSSCSRHLAQGVWDALLHRKNSASPSIECDSLKTIIGRASAEWPTG